MEDATPSSSSENCVQETPLVLSRCSSVSSLGSFESPSIASSIPSDPCSGLGSGTVSPSELPDSPGQTMPPSRSKTPPAPQGQPETSQFSLQWESYVKRFLDIADCRERCQPPSELDAGSVRFTVEKPDENFSCASSLSALALHELYVQQDVELRLQPPACPEREGGGGGGGHRRGMRLVAAWRAPSHPALAPAPPVTRNWSCCVSVWEPPCPPDFAKWPRHWCLAAVPCQYRSTCWCLPRPKTMTLAPTLPRARRSTSPAQPR